MSLSPWFWRSIWPRSIDSETELLFPDGLFMRCRFPECIDVNSKNNNFVIGVVSLLKFCIHLSFHSTWPKKGNWNLAEFIAKKFPPLQVLMYDFVRGAITVNVSQERLAVSVVSCSFYCFYRTLFPTCFMLLFQLLLSICFTNWNISQLLSLLLSACSVPQFTIPAVYSFNTARLF